MKPWLPAALLALAVGVVEPGVLLSEEQFDSPSGSTLGYAYNGGDGTLRPVNGILGSSSLGAPVPLDFRITQTLALDGRHFLASTRAGLVSINLESAAPSLAWLTGATSVPAQAVGSRSGTAAALYYPERRRILIVTGLPGVPTVAHAVDVSAHDRTIGRMAVNDTGSLLIYAASGEQQDTLHVWTASSEVPSQVATARAVSAIALARNDDAIVADAAGNEIFWLRNPGQAAIRDFLAGDRVGVSSPVGVMLTDDGQVIVANAGSQTILTLSAQGSMRTLACGCELSGIYRFRDSVYRLTDRVDRTLFLLDVSGGRQRVLFVPPVTRE